MKWIKNAAVNAFKFAFPTVALSGVVIAISKTLVDTVHPDVGGAFIIFGLPLAGWLGRYGSEKWW